jgi:hypothetical protein
VTRLALNQLVTGGQLAANEDGQPAEWIVPSERDRAPGLPRDPGELGSLGSSLPRGVVHAADDGDEDPLRGACRRHVARRAEPAQGRLHPQHDDNQQCRLGAGVVLPPQRRARTPPYTGLVLRERPVSWYHGVSPPQH